MSEKRSIKKSVLMISLGLVIIPGILVALALPFKQTQFFFLQSMNKSKPLTEKVKIYGHFVEKYPSYLEPRLKLAHYYALLGAETIEVKPSENTEKKKADTGDEKAREADERSEDAGTIEYAEDGKTPEPEEEQTVPVGDETAEETPSRAEYLDSSIEHYTIVLEHDPGNEDALAKMGNIYFLKKEYDKAIRVYEDLIMSVPGNSTYYTRLASVYYLRGEVDMAQETIKKGILANPEDGDPYMIAASIHELKRELPEVLSAYKKAIKYFKKSEDISQEAGARYRLGSLFLKIGLLWEAMQQFEESTRIQPEMVDSFIELAGVYSRMGLADKAITTIMESPLDPASWELAFYPTGKVPPIYRLRVYTVLWKTYISKGDYQNALKYFNKARGLGIKFNSRIVKYVETVAQSQKSYLQKIQTQADMEAQETYEAITPEEIIIKIEELEAVGSITPEGIEIDLEDIKHDFANIFSEFEDIHAKPWENVETDYAEGSIVEGKIFSIRPYAVLVELKGGIEGIINISDIFWSKKLFFPDEIYSVGDVVEAMVLAIDNRNRQVILGIKQLEENPWEKIKQRYRPGTTWDGIVIDIANFALTVEMEKNIYGLILFSTEESKYREKNKNLFKLGDIVSVEILGTDDVTEEISLKLNVPTENATTRENE